MRVTCSRIRFRVGVVLWASLLACFAVLPVSAHANLVEAEPGIGATVAKAPTSLRLTFSETPEPRYSDVTVFDAAKGRFDRGDLHPASNMPDTLLVDLKDGLPDGVYTVIWKTVSAVDGHNTGGSFAFVVGAGTLSGTQETRQTVNFSTPQPVETAAKWLAYAAASVLVGAFASWFLVWAPALGTTSAGERARLVGAVGGRVLTLAAIGATVLVVASVAGALAQLTKSTGQSLGASLAPGTLADFSLTTRAGSVWLLRLALALAALGVTLPPAIRARRGILITVTQLATRAFLGVVLGANVLLAMSLLSHAAASAFWPAVAVAIDWVHLLAMAIWIGGLVCLVRTVPLITRGEEAPGLLRDVVGRFSDMALVSVCALLLTGLYASWLHLGGPPSLLSTDYGRALTLKLAVFAVLIALGAFNLWWVRPRLFGDDLRATARRFRGAIAVEVAFGMVVLLVTATLTGLAPSREVRAASVSPLAQMSRVDDLTTTFTPSTLTPGPITYDALVTRGDTPVPDARQVAFRFSSSALGVEETERIAENRGDGHYVVSGPLTALPGAWQIQVIVSRMGRDNVNSAFTLPICGLLPPSPAVNSRPTVNTETVIAAIAIALAVIAAFIGAARLAQRIRGRQVPLMHAATHQSLAD